MFDEVLIQSFHNSFIEFSLNFLTKISLGFLVFVFSGIGHDIFNDLEF